MDTMKVILTPEELRKNINKNERHFIITLKKEVTLLKDSEIEIKHNGSVNGFTAPISIQNGFRTTVETLTAEYINLYEEYLKIKK